ncbi:DUF2235 domain-containing protein [Pseudooctadecabacter sp.]|uniref:DUF2235 domain-containing protein n=1 Tax=Pseudooctadecabacter sp. TaxID=1966338 RepID=UPI0025CCA414|nr:DUF2235 domain-containing protein [Pseudooctadecabacter sp.]
MKRIVIFIDGTWNRPDAEHPTNVVRLARCVQHRTDSGMPQVVLYTAGVGSGAGNNRVARKMDRVFGGTLGWGLLALMEDMYRRLVFAYEPGDEIMIFGFSRGAFAARSLVGFIRSAGICGRDRLRDIPAAVARYVSRAPETHPRTDESYAFRLGFAPRVVTSLEERAWRVKHGHNTAGVVDLRVAYLGVWDTVKALGLPAALPLADRFNRNYTFHDAKLSSMVMAARHAIAIDERRKTFPAMPWDNMEVLNSDNNHFVPEYLQQWFPGNHGSVGGGGSRRGLSSVALNWIMLGAVKAGLGLDWREMRHVADRFDVNEPLDNKFGPVGLASVLNHWSTHRDGPRSLSEMSMLAIDRAFADKAYRRTPTLSKVYDELYRMDETQRERMREAHRVTDGAYTHRLGQVTWPGPPEWSRTPDTLDE